MKPGNYARFLLFLATHGGSWVFPALLVAHDCPCRVAVLEENNCQAHFTRALADAFTSNFLQSQPLVAMQVRRRLLFSHRAWAVFGRCIGP